MYTVFPFNSRDMSTMCFFIMICLNDVHWLVELGRADDGDGFGQHQLVGAVSVKINAGEEGRLSRVSLKIKITLVRIKPESSKGPWCVMVYTHMYPAEGDEVVLVLHQKQLLLVLRVTVIRTAALLRDDHVGHRECVPHLEQATGTLHGLLEWLYTTLLYRSGTWAVPVFHTGSRTSPRRASCCCWPAAGTWSRAQRGRRPAAIRPPAYLQQSTKHTLTWHRDHPCFLTIFKFDKEIL